MSHEPRFGCSLVPWTWWPLQNPTFKGKITNRWRKIFLRVNPLFVLKSPLITKLTWPITELSPIDGEISTNHRALANQRSSQQAFDQWERSRQQKQRPISKLSPVDGEFSTNHRALACRCCLDSFKMAILEKSKQKIGLRKSWSVHNFAFKCPILKCSSCSRDQATAKTRFMWIQLNQGKKFCDI